MRRLIVFSSVTLDGYFSGAGGDIRWAHSGDPDPEFDAFVRQNASGGGELVFGRITYDLMAAYWPGEPARASDPVVAEAMNRLPKVVFSRTMDQAGWNGAERPHRRVPARGNARGAWTGMVDVRGNFG